MGAALHLMGGAPVFEGAPILKKKGGASPPPQSQYSYQNLLLLEGCFEVPKVWYSFIPVSIAVLPLLRNYGSSVLHSDLLTLYFKSLHSCIKISILLRFISVKLGFTSYLNNLKFG